VQFGDILTECNTPLGAQADPRARLLSCKILLDSNVFGSFKGIEMCAKIAIGGIDDGPERDKLQPLIGCQRVERGHDPRQFALIAFGGAGPMHAIGVAGLLGIPTVIAPRNPGVASAYGLLVADFRNDYSQTFLQKPPDYDLESMEKAFKVLETQAERWFDEERVPNTDRCITRAADLRYAHQGFEVTIELATRGMNTAELEYLLEKFHHRHQQLFGFSLDQPTEIVTLRVAATGRMTAGNTPLLKGTLVSPFEAKTGERQVYFKEVGGFTKCPIYNRARLAPESSIDGPGILEDVDSTVVIHPGWRGRIDQYGNCVLVMVLQVPQIITLI